MELCHRGAESARPDSEGGHPGWQASRSGRVCPDHRAEEPRRPGGGAERPGLRSFGIRVEELSGPGSDLAPPGKCTPAAKMAGGGQCCRFRSKASEN